MSGGRYSQSVAPVDEAAGRVDTSHLIKVSTWIQFNFIPQGLIWKRDGLKYLGIYLGNEKMMQKNWDGVLEKVEGRMAKWRWLRPQMSFRGVSAEQPGSLPPVAQASVCGPPFNASFTDSEENGGFLLGQLSLGPSERAVFIQGGGGTGPRPPGQ